MALIDDLVSRLQNLGIGGYEPPTPRKTIMALGDSVAASISSYDAANKVDAHINTGPTVVGHGKADWLFQANLLNNSALDVLGSAATGGYTIQQIRDVHLPTVLAAKPNYVVCWSMVGNNILSAGEIPQADFQVYADLLHTLENAGITPVLMTFLPAAGVDGATALEIERYNSFVTRMSYLRGYPLADVYSALVEPTTGKFKAGLSDDQVHPNEKGSVVVASVVAATLAPFAAPRSLPLAYGGATSPAILANGLMTSQANGVPTDWYISSGSGLAPQAGIAGNVLTLTRGGADVQAYSGGSLAATPGDIWDLVLKVKPTVSLTGAGKWQIGVVDQAGNQSAAQIYQQKLSISGFRTLHLRGRISVSTVTSIGMYFGVIDEAGAKLEVAEISLRNLSRLSIPLS